MMTGFDGLGLMGSGLMILFWVVIGALLIWGLGASAPWRGSATAIEPSALGILQQRYARGEISKEEFETARKVLD